MSAAASAVDLDAKPQAAGVYADFQRVIADRFRSDFAMTGEFSIRKYMQDPQGRTLLLDFPITSYHRSDISPVTVSASRMLFLNTLNQQWRRVLGKCWLTLWIGDPHLTISRANRTSYSDRQNSAKA